MRPIRTLIVDDEALARRGIRARLEVMPGVTIVGECGDGRGAVDAIGRLTPDLVLLDVQMPELSGFDVIQRVGVDQMPVVIFVTAYDAYALRAFDVQALDYVVKPIDGERLAKAVRRARARVDAHDATAVADRLAAAAAEWSRRDSRLAVRDRGRVVLLDTQQVTRIDADGDYVRIQVAGVTYLVRETLSAMAERLDPTRFARIHRSTIVQLSHVRELAPRLNGDFVVTLADGTRVRASRRYSQPLRALIDGGPSG